MLITVKRNIFNQLSGKALIDYTYGCVLSEYDEYNEKHNDISIDDVSKNIIKVISKNEELISKVGLSRYYNGDIKEEDCVSGFYYTGGKIVICPFDWSMSDEHDEDFEYTFTLAVMI